MNIYKIENRLSDGDMEILPGLLRQALFDRLPDAEVDPVFSLAYDTHSQFFLKRSGEIIWGRIFLEALTYRDIEELSREIEHLSRKYQRKLKPFIFIPPRFCEVYPFLEKVACRPLVYEYYFLCSGRERAVALKEILVRGEEPSEKTEELLDTGEIGRAHV